MQADQLAPLIGNRYQLEAQLGRGGMGAVYRAIDRLTREEVALKRVTVLTEHLQFATRPPSDSVSSGSTGLRVALAQEFQALASLRHPNIIRVLDYGFDAERQPYLTMDLLHQPQTLLAAGRGQPLEVKIDLLVQTLQALAYLHRRGITHRDLKPDNVAVVDEEGVRRVRVLDFGLALTPDFLNGSGRGMAGTLAYMAPEVLQGDEATEASDLYAMGVMAFEMLGGVHPFQAKTTVDLINKVLKTEPDLTPLYEAFPPPENDSGNILVFAPADAPPTVPEIVDRLLIKRPSERYHDAYVVIADLCAATGVPLPEESDAIRESFLQASRFVGREDEQRELRAALTAVTHGMGSFWLVGGESGVGKSRLLEELRTRALIGGVLTLQGQASATGGLPFQLWREPLRRLALSTELNTDEASVLVSFLLPEIDAWFDDLQSFDGGNGREQLTHVIIDLFRRQPAPILLLLEDLQWANESLDVLKQLAPFVEDLPLLIIGSFRDDERPRLPDDLPQARLLSLTRLGGDEIAELTASMLGETGMRQDVINFLQQETEGNAFFLVETVRALAEEAGSLSRIGQETLPEHLITGGMQQVIGRRLNRVPAWAQDLLRLAAVIGRDLDLTLLQAIIDANAQPIDLDDWLTTCANRAVFEVRDGQWRFAHDKLREALLDALMPDQAAADHQYAAQAIEIVYAADLEPYAAALTYHWRAAGDPGKEGQYIVSAATRSHENNAYVEACRLFERALEIHAYDDDTSLADIHHQLGDSLLRLSDYDAAREHQRQALALYRVAGSRKGIADALDSIGDSDTRQGLLEQAQGEIEEGLTIRLELGHAREIGYSYMNLGVIETQRDRWQRAGELFKLCLDYMEQGGTPRDLARALNNYGNVLDILGDHDGARQIHERALAIRESIHDLHGVSYSLGNLAYMEFDLEHYDQARLLFEQALRLARQVGDRLAIASDTSMLGELSMKSRDYEQARPYFQQALDVRRQIGDRNGIISSIRDLGNVARETGDHWEALERYRESLVLCAEYAFDSQIYGTLSEIAALLMAQGERRSALKLLAFVRAQRDTPSPQDQALIDKLEAALPPNAFASAVALGEALALPDILARVEQGDLNF